MTSHPDDYCPVNTSAGGQHHAYSRGLSVGGRSNTSLTGFVQSVPRHTHGSDQSGCSNASGYGRADSRLKSQTNPPADLGGAQTDKVRIPSDPPPTPFSQSDCSSLPADQLECSSHELVWDSLSEGDNSFELPASLPDDVSEVEFGEDSNQVTLPFCSQSDANSVPPNQCPPSNHTNRSMLANSACPPPIPAEMYPPTSVAPPTDWVPGIGGLTTSQQRPQGQHRVGPTRLKRSKQAFNSPFAHSGE